MHAAGEGYVRSPRTAEAPADYGLPVRTPHNDSESVPSRTTMHGRRAVAAAALVRGFEWGGAYQSTAHSHTLPARSACPHLPSQVARQQVLQRMRAGGMHLDPPVAQLLSQLEGLPL